MNYREVIKKAQLETGSYMIKVEVPREDLNKFREEYKALKGMSRFKEWDWAKEDRWMAEKVMTIIGKNKWDVEYRIFFNASAEQLEAIKAKYGDRVRNCIGKGRGEYAYHLDDNTLARELLKGGADIGRNNVPLPL